MGLNSSSKSQGSGDSCPAEAPIWSRLETSAQVFGERLAVASLDQPRGLYGFENMETTSNPSAYLRWSYNTLSSAVDRFAESLGNRKVGKGDVVVTYLYNKVKFVLSLWVAHKLGCAFVPLHPDSLLNQEEAVHVLRLVNPQVVVVDDVALAERFDAISHQVPVVPTKAVAGTSSEGVHNWDSLQSLLVEKRSAGDMDTPLARKESTLSDRGERPVTILFTSGTTSRPKGAPHNSKTLNAFCQNLSLGGRSESHVFCAVLPNNHAAGYFFTLHFMMNGGAIVYPSSRFHPDRILEAMEAESATHTMLVPTTLHRFAEALRDRSAPPRLCLQDVCLAGAYITPEDLRYVVHGLGSAKVSTGFGMTEGSPVWSSRAPPSSSSTKAGSSRAAVRLRERGGGGTDDSPFYEDVATGRLWFATGDQAAILDDGRVAITGRYKDMINRGGAKISPAAIEAVVQHACAESVQVVGVADELAGQVPIVVRENAAKSSAEEILRLRDLDLDDYPRTSSGKVQKGVLSGLCLKYVRDQDRRDGKAKVSSLEMGLLQAYRKATGIEALDIDKAVPATFFADSIALMRVRDQMRKSMGVELSIRDMADHQTIESQVLLLKERIAGTHSRNKKAEPFSPASLASICHSVDAGQKLASAVADMVNQQGFQWPDDVTAVVPLHDYMQVLPDSHIIDTWNFAIAIQTTKATIPALKTALCAALANNPVLTSLFVESEEKSGFYITLAPTGVLWNKCISVGSPLKKAADLENFAVDYPHRHHSRLPGPLFHAVIMRLEETDSAAMVFYVHHVVQDASSLRLFLSDLELALDHPNRQLAAHGDFRAWAESFQALRHSPMASLSVEYHVRRLEGLHEHRAGLYPAARVPRRAIEESPDGLDYQFDAPGLTELKCRLPGIDASTVLKAAMAIVNVSRTSHTHALFHNFEAGRGSFPFVPDSLAAAVVPPSTLDAADVNGPVMEGVCNLHAVPRRESGLALLARLQADQIQLTRHCHAPLRRVLAGLGSDNADAAEMWLDIHRAQFLTWVPGLLGDYARLRVARVAIRCAAGLVVVAGVGGPRAATFGCSLRWDAANYSRAEAARFISDVGVVVGRLTSAAGWEAEVGELVDLVRLGDAGNS
ncbi:acetyl-CoA synthetase-like protein [Apiospora marii]|uniref:Acetyl-CoA synthetase-like protein n=1 Tax=Apiospora marii TaxID=335849 RepID=A0ABR1RJG6_9PEZI